MVGELTFGTKHQDTKSWMIDEKTFWERWLSDRTIYMFVDEDDYRGLLTKAPNRLRIVAKHWDNLLIINTK